MPLAPVVIHTTSTILKNSLGKAAPELTKLLCEIVVQYGPVKQAQAKILQRVAVVAPYALALVSSAIATAITVTSLKKQVRLAARIGQISFALESIGIQSVRKSKPAKKKPHSPSGKLGLKTPKLKK